MTSFSIILYTATLLFTGNKSGFLISSAVIYKYLKRKKYKKTGLIPDIIPNNILDIIMGMFYISRDAFHSNL